MPEYSDSNRVSIRYVQENTWGATPASPSMKELNITSESFKSNTNTVTSNTIRSDRNVADITAVGGGAGGETGFELRYGDIEDLIQAALQGTWIETIASAGVASVTVSAAVIKADSNIFDNILVDQVIRVSECSTVANNGDYIVVAASTTGTQNAMTVVDASTGASATFSGEIFDVHNGKVYGKNIRNGVTARSFTVEKEFADVGVFAQYTGMRVTSMSLSFESQSILTGSFGFTGKSQAASSATVASATVAASTNEVMNASGNVVRVWEGGNAITGAAFKTITLDLNNTPREQSKIGSDALAGVATGRCEISGGLSAYFENNSLVNKFTGSTASSFRFQIQDNAGNAYVITVPRIKYTDFTVAAGGGNADVMQDGSWGATVDSNGLYAVQIDALEA